MSLRCPPAPTRSRSRAKDSASRSSPDLEVTLNRTLNYDVQLEVGSSHEQIRSHR